MEKLLSIGKIINFHGINGEVRVGYTAGKEKQLQELKNLIAVKNNDEFPLTVENIRFHKNTALIKFKEINSVSEAANLKGAYLKVLKSKLESYLEEDEFYIDDLIGMQAFSAEGKLLGAVKNVIDIKDENILVIDMQGCQHLVPFVAEIVPEVNIKENKLVINNIPGLLENG